MQLLNNYRPRLGLSLQRKIATIAKKLTPLNSCFISNFKILSKKKARLLNGPWGLFWVNNANTRPVKEYATTTK
jgi:hypothetical protein